MDGRDSFWLQLHNLATCIEKQGASPEARRQGFHREFQKLAPLARKEVERDIELVCAELAAIRESQQADAASDRVEA